MKVTLLYPPEQNWPGTQCKPNGSLAHPMLGGALESAGIEVEIYDACVGNDTDPEDAFFDEPVQLPSGMFRTGVSDERILEVVKNSDIVGITSIFSHQETMVLHCVRLIKSHYPDKTLVCGGVNARSRLLEFFDAGTDIIAMSEAEKTIVDLARGIPRGDIPYLAFQVDGRTSFTSKGEIIWDLDELPMPAWHLLPNERYWKIGRPHGGHFKEGEVLRYASMVTSMGCPFKCTYCHISGEDQNSHAGPIGRFRIKSDERVLQELQTLSDLGVKQVFIEDDSLLGRKQRAIRLIKQIRNFGLQILDVNGVNIVHLLKYENKVLVPDMEVLELLRDAGFREIGLPFESANPRIITKYATNKWDITNSDIPALVKACKDVGLRIGGTFMIGYPDESREEIMSTINYAKDRMQDGLDYASFFLVMPLPGTTMFDEAIRDGQLPKGFSPDKMHWQKANMVNTQVSPKELEAIRDAAWRETNDPEFIGYKKDMRVL